MSDDNVTPIRPDRPRPDRRLHPAARRAPQGARDLAAQQNEHARDAYQEGLARQRDQRLLATGRPVPARITLALDVCGLDGPDVDVACGTWERNPAGDVDMWELALAVPSAEQMRLLADLTGFPVPFFYEPIPPGPMGAPVWMCGGRRKCELVPPHTITEDGVLWYFGKPRELPAHLQGQLPGMPEPTPKPRRPRAEASTSRKTNTEQPAPVRRRMPEHLRADLMAKLNARKST